jgi:hypothetical protein
MSVGSYTKRREGLSPARLVRPSTRYAGAIRTRRSTPSRQRSITPSLHHSITPSLHVAGFEDDDEDEARGERMALTLKTLNLFQNIYLEGFFQ